MDELRGMRHEAFVAEVRESMAEAEAGNVKRYSSAAELIAELNRPEDE